MYAYPENNLNSYKKPIIGFFIHDTSESLELQWAKEYLYNLDVDFQNYQPINNQNLNEVVSQARREKIAQKLRALMRNFSLQGWNRTEKLLFKEVKRDGINYELIDPCEIAGDSLKVYEKALDFYTQQSAPRQLFMVMKLLGKEKLLSSKTLLRYIQQFTPNQLAKTIAALLGTLQQKYRQQDLQVIGFVNMQFHYISQMLLQLLLPLEQSLFNAYFKVIDEHLYMSLQRAYTSARLYYDWVALIAVHLLPSSASIAKSITQRVIELYPAKHSYSGNLNNKKVIIFSIRDVEMFQVYLWICADKTNISAIQQELFILYVILYPTLLKVSWKIIRKMLHLLGLEIRKRLNTEQANALLPYFQAMKLSVSS